MHPLQHVKVIKRDGRIVAFKPDKIFNAILKAVRELFGEISPEHRTQVEQIVEQVENEIMNRFKANIQIYDIQRIIEHELIANQLANIAKTYTNYRLERDIQRRMQLDMTHRIEALQAQEHTIVNENANKDSRVFNTQRDLTAGVLAKTVGLTMLPPHIVNAHLNGVIHYHDLDYQPYSPMTNCCLIDFKSMFEQGFKIGNAEVESPQSIQTATAQMAQIIANVASSQYGGCSADRIDEVLAPYALLNQLKHERDAQRWIDDEVKRHDYVKQKTQKDIYDAMQSLEYEINTLYTSQGQTPFTTLGFGLGTSEIERQIQQAILHVRIKGLGKEKRTAIFPKLVFTLKRGINLALTDPNYDIKLLAIECATKRMYPDVLMYDQIVALTGSFKVPMGCRSFLQGWQDEHGNEVNAGRMNLGVVTLNLPRIALEVTQSLALSELSIADKLELFWQILEERLSLCHDALVYRVNRVKDALPENAPILYQHGAFGKRLSADDHVDEVFRHRRATVSLGYIGLYEVGSLFYGGEWEHNPEAKDFTLRIVKKLKEHTDTWSINYGYHFSVYSTPSESLTDRFCRADKLLFGNVANVTDKDYYTNSFHYDVRKNPTPFEKIEFEKAYPHYCSGGFIHYCEYPNLAQNPKALEAVWDFAYDRIGYLGTNTPIDHCYECQFEGDFEPTDRGFKCPQCGNTNPKTCDVVKRTCGYLGNPQLRPMVHGRHQEIASRVKHMA